MTTKLFSFFSTPERSVLLSSLSKLQREVQERHEWLSSTYEDKLAGASSHVLHVPLEVIAIA